MKIESTKILQLNFWSGTKISFLFILYSLLFYSAFLILEKITSYFEIVGMDFLFSLSFGFATILSVYFLMQKNKLYLRVFKLEAKFFRLLIASFILMNLINYLLTKIIFSLSIFRASLQDYIHLFSDVNPIVLFIEGVLIAPACEEIIFRGILLECFLKKYHPSKAIFFSAFLFGISHLQPIQIIDSFFGGILFGWTYWKTKSLWIPIILHLLNNLITFLSDFNVIELIFDYFAGLM